MAELVMKYQQYAEYKDSGVEWLGKVPSHWDTKPLKYLCTYNDDVLPDSTSKVFELEYVDIGSVSSTEGITNTENMVFKDAPSRAKRIVQDGDVIVSTVRTYLEAIAPINNPPQNMIVSTGFAVIRPNEYLCKGYAAYCLRAKGFINEVVSLSVGVSYPAINATDLVGIKIPSLPFNEQAQIANFLDHETAQIDTLIERQQALIQLLKEKRQAVISHAVTKGLNPDAPMKDSGVEWLGGIPNHWQMKKLKYVGEAKNGLTYSPDDVTEAGLGTLVLRSSNIQNARLAFEDNVYVDMKVPERSLVRKDDILICSRNGSRRLIGKNALITEDLVGQAFGAFMVVFRSDINVYLYWILNSPLFEYQSGSFLTSTINQLTIGNLNSMEVPIPPKEEQVKIIKYLEVKMNIFDNLISKAEQAIQLMKERRIALISAAVTGKIDVRGWQAPDVIDDVEVEIESIT